MSPLVLSGACAVIGAAAFAWRLEAEPVASAFAWLLAVLCALTTALGALAVALVCDACGAVWFVPLRRAAEACAAALPAIALLFAPLLAGLARLYPWAGPPPADAHLRVLLAHRHAWLNPTAFAGRAALLFIAWLVAAEVLRRWSHRQDAPGAPDRSARRRGLAAACLLPLALTVTLAAVDWMMSLETTWASTIYGLHVLVGAFAAGTAAIILITARWRRRGRLPEEVGAEHRHALGKLLFAAVVLWAYLAFMQLLVAWMGDLPDEAAWYLPRLAGGWGAFALAVLGAHFIVPFALLLGRAAKRAPRVLVAGAVLVLTAHAADLAWLVLPAGPPGLVGGLAWRCLAAMLAVAGTAAALAAWRARGVSGLPTGDPDLAAGLAYRSGP